MTPGTAAAGAPPKPAGRTRATLLFWGVSFALGLVILATERAVLLAAYAEGEGGATRREWADAFLAGLRFDAAGIAPVMAAALVVSTLLRLVLRRGAERACAMAALALTVLVAVVEVPYFGQFHARIDLGVLAWLDDPGTTLDLVFRSADRADLLLALITFVVPVALAAWTLLAVRRRTLDICGPGRPSPVAVVVLLATFLAAARGGIARPLHLTDVDAAPRGFLGQVASSGMFTVGRQAWDLSRAKVAPQVDAAGDAAARDVARRVFLRPGDKPLSDDSPALRLTPGADTAPLAGWNIVLVLAESFSGRRIGCLGATGADAMTPAFDRLAANGVLFTRFLANAPAGAAVPAVLAGVPCVPRRMALTKSAEGQQTFLTLPHLLRERGWTTSFVSGGALSWDDLGGWLQRQGFERTIDRTGFATEDWPGVWGPHDRLVFDRTLAVCDDMAAKGPFFVSVQTTSNRPPFPMPDDAAPALGSASADPVRERAMRYADRELGRFLDAAQCRTWGRRTLFVVVGDHGFRVAPQTDVDPDRHHVPLLLLTADGRLPPRRDDRLASQVDVLPTLMNLVHAGPYVHAAWGRDLFAPDQAAERYAVLGPDGDAQVCAVVTDAGEFLVDRLDDTPASLFHLDFATHALTPIPGSRAEIERLRRLGRSYLRAADRTLLLRKAGG